MVTIPEDTPGEPIEDTANEDADSGDTDGAEIVSLDTFRKK